MSIRLFVGALLFVLTVPAGSLAQTKANPPLGGAELLAALRGGGYIVYFRHADTDWSQKDTRGMNFASPLCRTVETAVLAFGRADKTMPPRPSTGDLRAIMLSVPDVDPLG